jgi:hypothetical protein
MDGAPHVTGVLCWPYNPEVSAPYSEPTTAGYQAQQAAATPPQSLRFLVLGLIEAFAPEV